MNDLGPIQSRQSAATRKPSTQRQLNDNEWLTLLIIAACIYGFLL
jgi:hypothetical protein